jgi:hypothetical protein
MEDGDRFAHKFARRVTGRRVDFRIRVEDAGHAFAALRMQEKDGGRRLFRRLREQMFSRERLVHTPARDARKSAADLAYSSHRLKQRLSPGQAGSSVSGVTEIALPGLS